MSKWIATALALGMLSLSSVALAGEPPKQTHHCKMPDGSMDMAKTHKECKAAKGMWVKDTSTAPAGEKAEGAEKAGDKAAAPKAPEAKPAHEAAPTK